MLTSKLHSHKTGEPKKELQASGATFGAFGERLSQPNKYSLLLPFLMQIYIHILYIYIFMYLGGRCKSQMAEPPAGDAA